MFALGITAFIGGIILYGPTLADLNNDVSYDATQAPQTIEKEVEVQTLDLRIKTAQEAEMASTTAEAQAAYDAAFDQAMLEIELEVTAQFRKEIEARETELEKEVGVF